MGFFHFGGVGVFACTQRRTGSFEFLLQLGDAAGLVSTVTSGGLGGFEGVVLLEVVEKRQHSMRSRQPRQAGDTGWHVLLFVLEVDSAMRVMLSYLLIGGHHQNPAS